MKFQIKHFWWGIGVFFVGTFVIAGMAFLFLVETLGAGPMNKPPDGGLLKLADRTWFAPGYIARTILDYVFFGGPMPSEGNPSDLGYSDERTQKQEAISRIYMSELEKRTPAYRATWLINPISWGFIFMFVGALRKKDTTEPNDSDPGDSDLRRLAQK